MLTYNRAEGIGVLCAITCLAALLGPLPAYALQPRLGFDELAQASDAIFVGTVQQMACRPGPNGNTILTDVVFDPVTPVHKRAGVEGDLAAPFTLTHEGGQLGNIFMMVSDAPDFEVGGKYLLFTLMNGQVHVTPLIGGNQGLFRVVADADGSQEYVLTASRKGVTGLSQGRLECTPVVERIEAGQAVFAPRAMGTGDPIPEPWTSPDAPQPAVRKVVEASSQPIVTLAGFLGLVKQALTGPPPARPVLPAIFAANEAAQDPNEPMGKLGQSAAWQLGPEGLTEQSLAALAATKGITDLATAIKEGRAVEGGSLHTCGYVDLFQVMECVSPSLWMYSQDIHAMQATNKFMDIFRQRDDDGSFGHNWYSEICGFVTENQRKDAYGAGWGTAIGMCSSFFFSECGEILEADVMYKHGLFWHPDLFFTLGHYDRYIYLPTAMHELGHTWGLQRGSETYDYDELSIMHGAYHDIVEDGFGLHVSDVHKLRAIYDNQTSIQTVNDLGIESYYAQDGLKHATTDKWNWNAQTGGSYTPGETITVQNVTIENMSRYASPNVKVRMYLSSDRNGTTWECPTVWQFASVPAEQYAVFDLTTTIPAATVAYDTYYITLRITGDNDNWSWDDYLPNNTTSVYLPISVTCPSISAPTGVAASDGTSTTNVQVTWNAVSGAWAYQVYRADTNNSANAMALGVPIVTTTYYDNSALAGKTYYYWIKAIRECQTESAFSGSNAGYRALTSPVVTASDRTFNDRIRVTWPAAGGVASHYQVYRNTTYSLTGATAISDWQTGLSFDDLFVTEPLTQYFYWVKAAVSSTGTNASSLVLEWCGIGQRALPAPTGVDASDGTYAGYVRVTWTGPDYSGNKYYRVFRGVSADPGAATALGTWQTTTTYDDTTAAQGAPYYYWVKVGTSSSGNNASVYSMPDTGYRPAAPVSAPTGVSASDGAYTGYTRITWSAVSEATHYRVYRSQANISALSGPITGWISATSFNDTTVSPGLTMYYWVKAAVNDQGERASAFSSSNSGWRKLSPPDGLMATGGTYPDKIVVSWNAAAGASYYRVHRAETSNVLDATPLTDWISETSYEDTPDNTCTSYYYWLQSATSATGTKESALSSLPTAGYRALGIPSAPVASDGSSQTQITVTWSSLPGATQYRLYRNTVDDPDTASAQGTWTTATSYNDIYADPGKNYYYWIKGAGDQFGFCASPFSPSDSGWRALPAATNVVATDGTYSNRVRVTWSQSSSYAACRVLRGLTSDFNLASPISDWIWPRNFDDTTAEPGTSYYYWVVSAAGDGAHPTAAAGPDTGYRVVAAPANVMASKGTYLGFVNVRWEAVPDATHYRVYRYNYNVAAGSEPITDWITDLQIDDETAQQTVYYYYWVKAAADDTGLGASGWSTEDVGWRGTAPPVVTNAISRRTHSTAGSFDLDVSEPSGVEPRAGGPILIIVEFDKAIQAAEGLSVDSVLTSNGTVSNVTLRPDNLTLEIELSGVQNAQVFSIQFPGISDAYNPAAVVTDFVCFKVLAGDANRDGAVNIFDLVLTRNRLNQSVDATTFGADVNTDGNINIFDLVHIRNSLNQTASGACPSFHEG